MTQTKPSIASLLEQRVLILDGAMGSLIQRWHLEEEDYRGERFRHHPITLKNNNETLNLVRPDIITQIHREYLEAGADIIETNTFNAQRISMADFGLDTAEFCYETNLRAAQLACAAADEFTRRDPGKPRYVAGALGPMNRTLSLSPNVNDPGYRAVTFDQVMQAYYEQAKGLLDGGVDVLLPETTFDTLNQKAALRHPKTVCRWRPARAGVCQRDHYRPERAHAERANGRGVLGQHSSRAAHQHGH